MDSATYKKLEHLCTLGLAQEEMGRRLDGVTRARIGQHFDKHPELRALWRKHRKRNPPSRSPRESLERRRSGVQLLDVLDRAAARGFRITIAAAPRRCHIEGFPVAVHCFRKAHATRPQFPEIRYFHALSRRPHWVRVILFPTGKATMLLPSADPKAKAERINLRDTEQYGDDVWPTVAALRARRAALVRGGVKFAEAA